MGYHMQDHPNPNKDQYRSNRRELATGAIVIHTAESTPDLVLPDMGAEGVANWISRRDTYGSYHDIVDSDSVVKLGPYDWETFHVGVSRTVAGVKTRANSISLGLSFACRAHQWPNLIWEGGKVVGYQGGQLTDEWVDGALINGAYSAADMSNYIRDTRGYGIPPNRISVEQFWAGEPGFITHAELDPGRRTDPGDQFPWFVFLSIFADYTAQNPIAFTAEWEANVKEVQTMLAEYGDYIGTIDGKYGEKTITAARLWQDRHRAALTAADQHEKAYLAVQQIREAQVALTEALDR